MSKELRQWLWKKWMKDNPMNLKYFGIWLRSLEDSQIKIFETNMKKEKTC